MFKKLIYRLTHRKHYWRDIGFDELSELYASMMFRSLAMSLVGIFVPVYLYQHGHPIWEILCFFALMFAAQLATTYTVAQLIARVGPKHTILCSYVVQAVSMGGMLSLDYVNIPIYLIGLTFGVGNALFFTAFHIDFSKIKHAEHGGKEVGWMYTMEKVGAIAGPLVGGVVAFLFGSQYIFVAALVLLAIGAVPLMLTSEPVKTHQKLDFSSMSVGQIGRDIVSCSSLVLENAICVVLWPLFVGVVVFKDNPYIQLGSVASISIVASLLVARMIGRMIDHKKGRSLLRFGASINALIHLFRPFVSGYSTVLATNVANEGVTIAYRMPYIKGMYSAADEHPGNRIVYIAALEASGSFVRVVFFSLAGVAAFYVSNTRLLFGALFAVGSIASIMIMTERFSALDRK